MKNFSQQSKKKTKDTSAVSNYAVKVDIIAGKLLNEERHFLRNFPTLDEAETYLDGMLLTYTGSLPSAALKEKDGHYPRKLHW